MKILILYPGAPPKTVQELHCFSDVLGFYLIRELRRHTQVTVQEIPRLDNESLIEWYDKLDISEYTAVLALGLRYFSTVDPRIGRNLRARMWPHGFVCQIHDGSRLDNDPVDITFTMKDDSARFHLTSEANRHVRHRGYNHYVGWAADPELNTPQQDPSHLQILVDHTNYGPNPTDRTVEVLNEIRAFVRSRVWKPRWQSVRVRRFDSGRIVDVDLDADHTAIQRYDRSATIPFVDITREHGHAHIFCVTHPESVGLVVLETSLAGALPLVPRGFVPEDRLATVRHVQYDQHPNWKRVMEMIDPVESRRVASANNWNRIALRIRAELWTRQRIRQRPTPPNNSPELTND